MSAADLVRALDRQIDMAGTDITLRRDTAPTPTDLAVKASIRPVRQDEVTGGVTSQGLRVVLSPTGLDDAAWIAAFTATGGEVLSPPFDVDPSLPKRGDSVILGGEKRRITDVRPILVNQEVVRIEVMVS